MKSLTNDGNETSDGTALTVLWLQLTRFQEQKYSIMAMVYVTIINWCLNVGSYFTTFDDPVRSSVSVPTDIESG